PGILFGFTPECCSASARNPVRLAPECCSACPGIRIHLSVAALWRQILNDIDLTKVHLKDDLPAPRALWPETVPSGLQKRANPRGPGGRTTQVGSQDRWLPPKCKTHPACANARAEQRSGPSCNYHGQTLACRGLPIDNAPSARVTIHQYPCGSLPT